MSRPFKKTLRCSAPGAAPGIFSWTGRSGTMALSAWAAEPESASRRPMMYPGLPNSIPSADGRRRMQRPHVALTVKAHARSGRERRVVRRYRPTHFGMGERIAQEAAAHRDWRPAPENYILAIRSRRSPEFRAHSAQPREVCAMLQATSGDPRSAGSKNTGNTCRTRSETIDRPEASLCGN